MYGLIEQLQTNIYLYKFPSFVACQIPHVIASASSGKSYLLKLHPVKYQGEGGSF